jgi:uncharacterized iron-regulated membrane protein
MKLRTLIFWPHLIAGVLAGIVILLMSVTGVLLTYERQMIAWSDSHLRSQVPESGAPRLPVETLLQTIRQQHPDVSPTAVTVGSAPDAAVTVAVPQRTLFFDAYSGRLLGEGTTGVRRFMSETRAWHRWLSVEGEGRPIARAITGWSNVIFLFIVVSGFYLWFPRKWTWKHLRPVVVFTRTTTGKARDFNWHNVIGVWSSVPLFIVVLTCMPISFPWANAAVYQLVGEDPPAARGREGGAARGREGGGGGGAREGGAAQEGREGGGQRAQRDGAQREGAPRDREQREGGQRDGGQRAERERGPSFDGLNNLMSRAEQQVEGWRTINLRIPESGRAPAVFAIDQGDGGQPQLRSTLTLDRATGNVVTYESFESQSLGRRLRSISRFAHTGEVLGIPGQTIAGLASAGGAVLVWTGIALAWRRWRAWMKRRAISETAESVPERSSAA